MTRWFRPTALSALSGALASLLLIPCGCRPKQDKDTQNAAVSPQASQPTDPNAPQIIKPNPNVPKLEFRNQDDKPKRLTDLRGKPVLISFIYTRCAIPTMCPQTMKQFVAVQKALEPEERAKMNLLLVSFDPEFDTPEVLKKYGDAFGVDWSNLQMWTGSKQDIFDLTDSFNMWYKEESGDYAHRTFSVVLNAEGRFVSDLRGADWDIPGAVELLRSLFHS